MCTVVLSNPLESLACLLDLEVLLYETKGSNFPSLFGSFDTHIYQVHDHSVLAKKTPISIPKVSFNKPTT